MSRVDIVEFRTEQDVRSMSTHIVATIRDSLISPELLGNVVSTLRDKVVKHLTDEWLDKHGVELLESLTPGEVEAAMKRAIATRLFGV